MSDPIRIVQQIGAVLSQEKQQECYAQALLLRAVACPVTLQRTAEAVWPEDEQLELAELYSSGLPPVPSLEDEESDAVLAAVTVALPDRLYPVCAGSDDDAIGDTATQDSKDVLRTDGPSDAASAKYLVGFTIPTSFSAPDGLTLTRMRLRIALTTPQGTKPVAVKLVPKPEVAVDEQRVAQFEVDIGKIMSLLYPPLSGSFVARVNKTFDVTTVHPKVQTAGLFRHECSWRIADPHLEYDFQPAIVMQHHAEPEIRILAELHVEVRKKMFGVWHRTYGKSAEAMLYVYRPDCPVISAFDYVHKLAVTQSLSGTAQRYERGDDASAALHHLGRLIEETHADGIPFTVKADGYSISGFLQDHEGRGERGFGAQDSFGVWYLRAAEAGNLEAMRDLGRVYEAQGSFDNAKYWYQRAAELGDAYATECLRNVEGNRERYKKEDRLRQLATAGSTDAMVELAGELNEHQWPATAEAERWLRKASEAGNDMAMFYLGQLMEERANEDGHVSNTREINAAEGWYRQAAHEGNTLAKRSLVRLHPWRFWYRLRP